MNEQPALTGASATGESTERPRDPDYRLDADGPASLLMRACIADARNNTARQERDRADWNNLLKYRGDHYKIWDRSTQQYVDRGYDPEKGGLPEYVPRPYTNIFGNKIDGIAAILTQAEPAKEVNPSTADDRDVSAAKVAEDAIPVLLEEIGYTDDLKPRASLLVTLLDKIFLFPYYDTDPKYGLDVIPDYQCTGCSVVIPSEEVADDAGDFPPCPECGEALQMAVDPMTQAPIGREEPIGRLRCELVPSFEASLPSSARVADATQVPWVLTHTRMDIEEIEHRWPDAKRLKLHERRGGTSSSGIPRHFADSMAALSSPTRASRQAPGGGTDTNPVVYRLQHDPITTDQYHFPDGLTAVMVDDQIVEATPLPVTDGRGRPVKSCVIWQYAPAPGSAFGKPPGDDLAPLQDSRNIVEALALLILMHDAAPRTYIPMSVTLENEPTGAPGENIYYRSVVPGEKPSSERNSLGGIDALYRHLEIIDAKMDEISKLNSVLQGSRPTGDPTLGEIQILEERGMSAFRPATDRLSAMEKQLCKLLLYIARESAWSPRFRQILGENGEWDVQQFSGADLAGNIDIDIDSASAWPKSPLMQRQMLKEAFAMGLFPPPLQDPELASKVLTMLNLAHLKPSMDLDRKQVGRKLSKWKQATTPAEIAPPDPMRENLAVHALLLGNFLKTEEFEALLEANAPLAQAMQGHVAMIGQILAQQAAAQMAAQTPDDRSPAEKGDDSALTAALDSGALVPADAQPDPMAALMEAGALTPADAVPQGGMSIDQMTEARLVLPVMPAGPAGGAGSPM